MRRSVDVCGVEFNRGVAREHGERGAQHGDHLAADGMAEACGRSVAYVAFLIVLQ